MWDANHKASKDSNKRGNTHAGWENDGYKHLGILEADGVKLEEMKEQTKKEYVRGVRKILKLKLK